MERRTQRVVTMSGSPSLPRKFFIFLKLFFIFVFIASIFVNISLSTIGSKLDKRPPSDSGEIGPKFVRSFSDISNSEFLRFILTNGTGDVSESGNDVAVEIVEPFIQRLRLAEEGERQREMILRRHSNNNSDSSNNKNNNNNNNDGNNGIGNRPVDYDATRLRHRQKANDDTFLSLLAKNIFRNAIVKPQPIDRVSDDAHDGKEARAEKRLENNFVYSVRSKGNNQDINSLKTEHVQNNQRTNNRIKTTSSKLPSQSNKTKKEDKNASDGGEHVAIVPKAHYEKEKTENQRDNAHLKGDISGKTNHNKNAHIVGIIAREQKEVLVNSGPNVKQQDSMSGSSRVGTIQSNKEHSKETKKDVSLLPVSLDGDGKKPALRGKESKEKAGGMVQVFGMPGQNSQRGEKLQTSGANGPRGEKLQTSGANGRQETGGNKDGSVGTSLIKHNVIKKLPFCNEYRMPLLVGRMAVQTNVYNLSELNQLIPHVGVGGHFRPTYCIPKEKTAIIIPYRNRERHLALLLLNLYPVLKRQGIDFTIFVIDENLPTPFNRAMLLNIGFLEASKLSPFDCFIFHDVDLLPLDDRNMYQCHAQAPTHFLAGVNKFEYRLAYSELFGGVVAFTTSQYRVINGASNLYFGWGGEDDDLRKRCVKKGYSILRKSPKVGMYDMVQHSGDKTNNKNPVRGRLLRTSTQRQDVEGLNTTLYHVTAIDTFSLYTRITVSINFTQVLETAPKYMYKEVDMLKGSFSTTSVPKNP